MNHVSSGTPFLAHRGSSGCLACDPERFSALYLHADYLVQTHRGSFDNPSKMDISTYP